MPQRPLFHSMSPVLLALLLGGCAHTPDQPAPEREAPEAPPTEAVPAPTTNAPEAAAEPADQTEPARKPAKTRKVTISLHAQQFTYREDGEVVRRGPISSGTAGHATPTGRFSVLSKDQDKVSSRYTNQLGMQAWMPYAIQFHSHYFMHEGWLPGYPDSHGCVRVGEQDARFLFERLRIGDKVMVVR